MQPYGLPEAAADQVAARRWAGGDPGRGKNQPAPDNPPPLTRRDLVDIAVDAHRYGYDAGYSAGYSAGVADTEAHHRHQRHVDQLLPLLKLPVRNRAVDREAARRRASRWAS